MFGPHLMLDCYDCNKEKLKDLNFVLKFLDKLPELIGMHKLAPPHAISYNGKPDSFDRGGISAVVIIAESHISCHTFPHNGYMNLDIFSCKDFDIEKVIDLTVKIFEAKKHEKNILMRGREFPKEISKAIQIVKKQRKVIKLLK